MYIALVCPYDLRRPGGVRTHIAGLGAALVARGHRVEVIAPKGESALGELAVVECGGSRDLGFGGTHIDVTWASWTRVGDVARRGYDVMHFHTIWNPFMPLQLAARFRGPKVATFHDVPGPHTPMIARAAMTPAAALIRRLFLRRVVAVSPVVSQYLKTGHEIIPNGIATPALAAEVDRAGILFVGRLEPRKGVDVLLRAIAELGADAPPLRIAGDGGLRQSLLHFVQTRGLSRVQFLGEISDASKWDELRRAQVLVAPSVGGESFGIVLTEAMSAGAIPLASDIPGYRHVLGRMAPDLTFAAGDAAALARRIRDFTRDGLDHTVLRTWCVEHARQFQWDALVERVERVYADAIRG